jgi:hypothetical protein
MTHLALITLALLYQDHLYRPTPHLGDGYWQQEAQGSWLWTWPGRGSEATVRADGFSRPPRAPEYMPPRGTAMDGRGRVIPPNSSPRKGRKA